jgi:hypothetical protein
MAADSPSAASVPFVVLVEALGEGAEQICLSELGSYSALSTMRAVYGIPRRVTI